MQRHLATAPRDGLAVPDELPRFLAALSRRAMGGQEGTALDAAAPAAERPPVPVLAVTYEEVAQMLSVSTRTVKRLVHDGHLAVTRVGGCARIRVADVEAYLDQPTDSADSA